MTSLIAMNMVEGLPELAARVGGGEVFGPEGATDKAAARFDTSTGLLLQDSALLVADTTGGLSRVGGGGVPVQGSNTNDAAAAGQVGELIAASRVQGSALALTTAVAANITTMSLTSGDWDVRGSVYGQLSASTSITDLIGSISLTSATLDLTAGRFFRHQGAPFTPVAGAIGYAIPTSRISLSTTTTIYLVVRGLFSAGTLGGWGEIAARRVR